MRAAVMSSTNDLKKRPEIVTSRSASKAKAVSRSWTFDYYSQPSRRVSIVSSSIWKY
jgi:predicted NAD-dependent protein-ADP-ribosyltransferase YbiA (DUF1768 family)